MGQRDRVKSFEPCVFCEVISSTFERARIRSNLRALRLRSYTYWRCQGCGSLHCEPVGDLDALYRDYPLHQLDRLDYFHGAWQGTLVSMLQDAGLEPGHSVLDYGGGSGLLAAMLSRRGYADCTTFDPFVPGCDDPGLLEARYDLVACIEVLEHVEDPGALLDRLASLLVPGGRLFLTTPRADAIDLGHIEAHLHQLHAPFHRHIPSERGLAALCASRGLPAPAIDPRHYRDGWRPFTSRRFYLRYAASLGNDFEVFTEPVRLRPLLTSPALWLDAFLGKALALPADDMAVTLRAASPAVAVGRSARSMRRAVNEEVR